MNTSFSAIKTISLRTDMPLKEMYDTICSQNCQICQFSVINEYFFGIKKYRQITDINCIVFEKIDIINNEIAGLFGDKSSHIDNCLFSKIFSTVLLKMQLAKLMLAWLLAKIHF